MSDYKPITDELRDAGWRIGDGTTDVQKFDGGTFDNLCDAIDAVHAQLERENAALKAELDRVLGEDERATMPLPKDMDGKPIRIGDVMEWYDGETFDVVGIGDGVLFYVKDGHEQADWTYASTKRHHQPDTWESIIYDAMQAGRTDASVDVTPLIERCKALCESTKEEA